MTVERIASHIAALGFLTDYTDTCVTAVVGDDLPVTFTFDTVAFEQGGIGLTEQARTFAQGLDETELYVDRIEEMYGLEPTNLANLELEDFQDIMTLGGLERARADARNTVESARLFVNKVAGLDSLLEATQAA